MGERISILLIEENESERAAFEDFFQQFQDKYTPVYSESMTDALQKLPNENIDVIITDIACADGQFFDLMPHTNGIPVVIITARGYEEIAAMAIKKGAVAYIVRDIEKQYMDMLPEVIDKALEDKRRQTVQNILAGALKRMAKVACAFTPTGRLIFTNDLFCRMFALDGDYFEEHTNIISLLEKYNLSGEPPLATYMEQENPEGMEYSFVHPNTNDTVKLMIIPVEGNPGKISGYMMMA